VFFFLFLALETFFFIYDFLLAHLFISSFWGILQK